jgi:hypothetical protein
MAFRLSAGISRSFRRNLIFGAERGGHHVQDVIELHDAEVLKKSRDGGRWRCASVRLQLLGIGNRFERALAVKRESSGLLISSDMRRNYFLPLSTACSKSRFLQLGH